jgi:alpha-beta hydrolase superfamily lysophospholipase
MKITKDYFTGKDGIKLYYEAYIPKKVEATLIIVHGLSEYIASYDTFRTFLTDKNIAVYGFDARGHGNSPGIRAHVNRWSEYTEDLHCFVQLVQKKQSGKLLMFAHSMGTTIATNYLMEYQDHLDGLVLCGTTIKPVEATKWYLIPMAKLLSWVAPRVSINLKLNVDAVCSDPNVVARSKADDLKFSTVTPRWGTEILKAIERSKKNVDIYSMPLLVIHGKLDKINDFEAAKNFFEDIPSEDKSFITYENSFHEVLNDVEKEKAFEDIYKFMRYVIERTS